MWNHWKHVRLSGGLMALVGVLMSHTALILFGLMIQYVGVLGATDLLERRITALEGEDDAISKE